MSGRDLTEIYYNSSQTTLTDRNVSTERPPWPNYDLESGKTCYFSSEENGSYQCQLKRDSSIATAVSMRNADIVTFRDNSQRPNNLIMGDDEEDTITEYPTEKGFDDCLLLYEKKKSIIILLGRLLLKCGCPCHRVVRLNFL